MSNVEHSNQDPNEDASTPSPIADELDVDSDEENLDTPNVPSNDTSNVSTSHASRKPTKNGTLHELQLLLSVACYEAANKKDMKTEELMAKCHEQLFSNSTRMGFAEQLVRGEGHFAHLFERVPVESHGVTNNNNTTTTTYKLKFKDFLIGDYATNWHIDNLFAASSTCHSSCNSSTKISPKTFMHKRFRVAERNIKKIGAKFSALINNKDKHTPETDNESGKTYEDYFIQALDDVKLADQDNNKSHPLASSALAVYLFSPYSPFPSHRLASLSISDTTMPNQGRCNACEKLKTDKDHDRTNDPNGDRGLSIADNCKKQKLDAQSKMVEAHNNKVIATRMNTYMVTLASRIDSEMQNM